MGAEDCQATSILLNTLRMTLTRLPITTAMGTAMRPKEFTDKDVCQLRHLLEGLILHRHVFRSSRLGREEQQGSGRELQAHVRYNLETVAVVVHSVLSPIFTLFMLPSQVHGTRVYLQDRAAARGGAHVFGVSYHPLLWTPNVMLSKHVQRQGRSVP